MSKKINNSKVANPFSMDSKAKELTKKQPEPPISENYAVSAEISRNEETLSPELED